MSNTLNNCNKNCKIRLQYKVLSILSSIPKIAPVCISSSYPFELCELFNCSAFSPEHNHINSVHNGIIATSSKMVIKHIKPDSIFNAYGYMNHRKKNNGQFEEKW